MIPKFYRPTASRKIDGALPARFLILGLVLISPSGASVWAQAESPIAQDMSAVTSSRVTFDTLLSEARRLNPDIAGAALAADAAAARADGAGKLGDPTLSLFSDQNQHGWPTPGSRGNLTYTVQQAFSLWGKRTLKREAALAEARAVAGDHQAIERDISARLRVLYAEYYRASQTLALIDEGHRIIHGWGATSENRYAQGLADRQEETMAGIERSKLTVEELRLKADVQKARIRLNTLLARPADAPLGDPAPPPPVPLLDHLNADDLVDRARQMNPAIVTETARVEAATANRSLAGKAWSPDLTVGVGLVDNAANFGSGRRWSYEGMISINLPLAWGVKRAGEREATAMLSEAEAKRQSALANAEADIRTTLADLQATNQIITTTRDDRLSQADLGYHAALDAYRTGRGALPPVIEAYHQWLDAKQDLLAAEAEQQNRFADLERAVGADL